MGSTVQPRSEHTQSCSNIVWWEDDACVKSSYLSSSNDYYEMTTRGDFHMSYLPYDWDFDTSPYVTSDEATGFAQPGSWGHTCRLDPYGLYRIGSSDCEGYHGDFP